MRNVLLTLEYDGTGFSGWQVQPGRRTVQAVVEEALSTVLGHAVRVHGSGRTDAGVHALGQTASFTTPSRRRCDLLARSLNGVLPPDVSVVAARDVASDLHARYSALSKTYRYTMLLRPSRSPLLWKRALHVPYTLDLAAMEAALGVLQGRHDFSAFRTAGSSAGDPVRTVSRAQIHRDGDLVHIELTADGFLRGMVRAIVGTLLQIGRGKRPVEDMEAVLSSGDRRKAGPAARPHGLYLVCVEYDPSQLAP